ncbi:MAG: hypothetical protein ACHQAZ_08035 [Gammaproteobacteria bacterium]
MNRTAAILATLLALALVAHAASAEARILKTFKAPCATVQASITIPDNALTDHGAIATPDGLAHF